MPKRIKGRTGNATREKTLESYPKKTVKLKKKLRAKYHKIEKATSDGRVKKRSAKKKRHRNEAKEANRKLKTEKPISSTSSQRRITKKDIINICTSSCCYDVVRRISKEFELVENANQWHVYWTDTFISAEKFMGMKSYQRINHFPGMVEICRKDLLARKLVLMSNRFPYEYDFFPRTWSLPNELVQAMNFSKMFKTKIFIVKPCFGSKGRGIQLIRDLKAVRNLDRMICQVYISKPLLIDGFKNDFRVYALLTSCDPLRLYVYNEGIVRFATKKYEDPTESNFSNKFMHLTNFSVNRHNSSFVFEGDEGSKRKLSTVNDLLRSRNYDVQKIWDSIDDSIVKTVLMVVPTLRYCYKVCFPGHETSQACFEILGFDFILNRRLKPYLLEVNHSPSFYCHTQVDFEVKESLLRDTFRILDLNGSNSKMPTNVKIDDKFKNMYAKKKIRELERIREREMAKSKLDWENANLGNYRLVYPNVNSSKYDMFLSKKQRLLVKSKNKIMKDAYLGNAFNESAPNLLVPQPSIVGQESLHRVRNLLLQSHFLINNVYTEIKNAGQKKIEDEVELYRRQEWVTDEMFSDVYHSQRENMKREISGALKCISRKSELPREEKELLTSLLLKTPNPSADFDELGRLELLVSDVDE